MRSRLLPPAPQLWGWALAVARDLALLPALFLALGLTPLMVAEAAAQTPGPSPVGIGHSPIVTWDSDQAYGTRSPTLRPLTADETRNAKLRAERVFAATQGVPSFSQPQAHATYLTSWAVVNEHRVVEQKFVAYWSDPRDVRQRADGALWPVMGGAHQLIFSYTNRVPNAADWADRAQQDFARRVGADGPASGYFARPPVQGEIGGGHVYASHIVITRDGRDALEPAPIAALLDIDIAVARQRAAEADAGARRSLEQLHASMQPQAQSERRARREASWAKQTRDPAAMAQRLDAAARTDQVDYERQTAFHTAPATPDPRHPLWSARLALQALEQQRATLTEAGASAAACGWIDTRFARGLDVRWSAVGAGAPSGCKPMVRIRSDLIQPVARADEIQLFTAVLTEDCGLAWRGAALPRHSVRCSLALPLLRDLDWSAVRSALGWP